MKKFSVLIETSVKGQKEESVTLAVRGPMSEISHVLTSSKLKIWYMHPIVRTMKLGKYPKSVQCKHGRINNTVRKFLFDKEQRFDCVTPGELVNAVSEMEQVY